MNSIVHAAVILAATTICAASYAQGFNEYGLRQPMTKQEFARYDRCREMIRLVPMDFSVRQNARQMTLPEFLGAPLTKRMCACMAVRTKIPTDDFNTVWASCARDIIGADPRG